jgi:hypothetical protein
MTTGALIFAYNNEQIDYVAMAKWSARNIERHLGIPTTVITDNNIKGAGKRHFTDVGTVTWHNLNRMNAYALSPYERTLVLDADYVVASDQLKLLLQADQDFMCHRWAYDITGLQTFEDLNYFGTHRFPMWWATVMVFNRCKKAELIFDSMSMIRDNWTHYRQLYGNTRSTYRNDHALSIALNIENGHTLETTDIPWQLASITPTHTLTQVDNDCYRVEYVTAEGKKLWVEVTQDFHAMGKSHLGEIVANNS